MKQFFSRMNVRTKMYVYILLPIIVILSLSSFISYMSFRSVARKQAEMVMEGTAKEYARYVSSYMGLGMNTAQSLAGYMGSFEDIPVAQRREEFNNLLKQSIETNSDFTGIWTCWEPGALDGMDAEYAGSDGHDSTGRFIPLWMRSDDEIVQMPLVGYAEEESGQYYSLVKQMDAQVVVEPYLYEIGEEAYMMTSLVAPIHDADGNFVGAVGVNLSGQRLQDAFGSISVYETGFGRMMSAKGYVVAHPNTDRIDKIWGEEKDPEQEQQIFARLKEGGIFTSLEYSVALSSYTLKSFAPVFIGEVETPWIFSTVVPQEEVYQDAQHVALRSILSALITVLIVSGLILFVSNNLTRPLGILTNLAERIAVGDLVRDISDEEKQELCNRTDELGQIGQAFLQMVDSYLQVLADQAKVIADGDLTIKITPLSQADELGHAFAEMVQNLREVIGLTFANANTLGSASEQLAVSTGQTQQAVSQIASAVQEAAHGIQQQVESTNQTAISIEQLSRAVDGVASGAQEQSQAILETSTAIGELSRAVAMISDDAKKQVANLKQAASVHTEMNDVLQNVSQRTEEVANIASEAANSAAGGVDLIKQTVSGMQSVYSATEQLSQRVNELSRHTKLIGSILLTIEEIAAQTNLLSLNAAIEAARAGEHGKGFAVVADEVRKLSERSASATQDIAQIINTVQSEVNEVISAMERAGADVNEVADLTNQAGDTFIQISNGSHSTSDQVLDIRQGLGDILKFSTQLEQVMSDLLQATEHNQQLADEMNIMSQQVVESVDHVSAVIEENTAAAEQMSASASIVTDAVDNIASVSEENSAVLDAVNSSTEDIDNRVREVAKSAQSLAEMAGELNDLVSKFQV